MITTKNHHGETVNLTFIRTTDDNLSQFQGDDNMIYFLEQSEFIAPDPKSPELEIVDIDFIIDISGFNKKVALQLNGMTHHNLCRLMDLGKSESIKDFRLSLINRGIKASINTKFEASVFAKTVLEKIQELKPLNPKISNWM